MMTKMIPTLEDYIDKEIIHSSPPKGVTLVALPEQRGSVASGGQGGGCDGCG